MMRLLNNQTADSFRSTCLLVFFTVVGGALRFYQLGAGMWQGDEARLVTRMVWFAKGLIHLANLEFTESTLYHFYGLIIHPHPPAELVGVLVGLFFGVSEFWTRFPFVLLGIILVPLIYYVGGKIFDRQSGLVSAMWLAISPYFVGWSRVAQFQIMHMVASGVLILTMWQLAREPNLRRLKIVTLVWSLALLIHVDFIVVLPIIAFLALPILKRMGWLKVAVSCGPGLLPTLIFYLTWITIGLWKAPDDTGFLYVFTARKGHEVSMWDNVRFYFRHFFANLSIAPLVALAFVGSLAGYRRSTGDVRQAFQLCYSWIGLFLTFFFFINRVPGAYLQEIMAPLILLAGHGVTTTFKSRWVKILTVVCITVIFGLVTARHLTNPPNVDINVMWGYRPADSQAMQSAAYVVRHCVPTNGRVLSNIDGYTTALYFDRMPANCQDQSLSALHKCLEESSGASLVEAMVWRDEMTLEDNESIKWLLHWNGETMVFDNTIYLTLHHPCNLPFSPDMLASLFRYEFANLQSIRQQEPWQR